MKIDNVEEMIAKLNYVIVQPQYLCDIDIQCLIDIKKMLERQLAPEQELSRDAGLLDWIDGLINSNIEIDIVGDMQFYNDTTNSTASNIRDLITKAKNPYGN